MTATINEGTRTPAAAARRLVKTERLARELVERLPEAPDALVNALAVRILEEFYRRRGAR